MANGALATLSGAPRGCMLRTPQDCERQQLSARWAAWACLAAANRLSCGTSWRRGAWRVFACCALRSGGSSVVCDCEGAVRILAWHPVLTIFSGVPADPVVATLWIAIQHWRRAGAKTGRSPRDKRVVRESNSEADIWWAAANNAPANGSPNYVMDEKCVPYCLHRPGGFGALLVLLAMLLGGGFSHHHAWSFGDVAVLLHASLCCIGTVHSSSHNLSWCWSTVDCACLQLPRSE